MSESNGLAPRDTFLRPAPRRVKDFEVPEVGKVRIQSASELERARLESQLKDKQGNPRPNKLLELKCRLMVIAQIDSEGKPMFSESDIPQLMQQDSRIINIIADEIVKHLGFSSADIEELEKN